MRRRFGLVALLVLFGCSSAPGAELPRSESAEQSTTDSGDVSATVAEIPLVSTDPIQALGVAAQAMSRVSDVTYTGTARIKLGKGHHRFDTQWVLAPGGTCQVTNRSKHFGEVTTLQLRKASYDRYDRRAVVQLLQLPGYYAQDYAKKWVPAERDLLGARACLPGELVPGPRFRSTFVAAALTSIGDRQVRRFDGQNEYGRVSLWIATTGDPVVVRWRGAVRGESRDLWLRSVDKGRELSQPPEQRIADLP